MPYTDDPVADFKRHDKKQQDELDKLPQCCECDHPIQDEFCYEINGELVCENCMNDNHRKCVDDFREEFIYEVDEF